MKSKDQNSFEIWKDKFIAEKLEKIIKELNVIKNINTNILLEKECPPQLIQFYQKGANDIIEQLNGQINFLKGGNKE